MVGGVKNIDIKSLIIGFLAAIILTVACGAVLAGKQVGKYQIAYDHHEAKMCVVDTSTGKVWIGYPNAWVEWHQPTFKKIK